MKQLSTLILVIAGSLAISAIAVAYARPGVSAPARSAVTISQTNTAAALGPGTSSVIRLDITNHGPAPQHVRSVHLERITADTAHASCDVSTTGANAAFAMPDIPVAATLAAHTTTSTAGSLTMHDTAVDQNACQGATFTLRFSSR